MAQYFYGVRDGQGTRQSGVRDEVGKRGQGWSGLFHRDRVGAEDRLAFTQQLSALLAALYGDDVPVLKALEMTANSASNVVLKEILLKVRSQVADHYEDRLDFAFKAFSRMNLVSVLR